MVGERPREMYGMGSPCELKIAALVEGLKRARPRLS